MPQLDLAGGLHGGQGVGGGQVGVWGGKGEVLASMEVRLWVSQMVRRLQLAPHSVLVSKMELLKI